MAKKTARKRSTKRAAPRQRKALEEAGVVATEEQNARLEHTEGGVTTRDDATDLGVPMLAGAPDEPSGPEDALGEGPKRGDYRNRLGGGYEPHEIVPVADPEPGGPTAAAVRQRGRAEDIGEEPGVKGGVQTG